MKFTPYKKPYGVEFHPEGYNCGVLFVRGALEVGDFLTSRIPEVARTTDSGSDNLNWWQSQDVDAYLEDQRDDVLMAVMHSCSSEIYEEYGFDVEPEWHWHHITQGGKMGVQRVEDGKLHVSGVIHLRG